MPEQENSKRRYVFQVIRDEIVRTEIIKATSQEEAEKTLAESDPECSFKFLWIQTRTKLEEPPKYIWVRVFLIFAAIFLVTGFLLLVFNFPNHRYLFFSGIGCLLLAAINEWWNKVKE